LKARKCLSNAAYAAEEEVVFSLADRFARNVINKLLSQPIVCLLVDLTE